MSCCFLLSRAQSEGIQANPPSLEPSFKVWVSPECQEGVKIFFVFQNGRLPGRDGLPFRHL